MVSQHALLLLLQSSLTNSPRLYCCQTSTDATIDIAYITCFLSIWPLCFVALRRCIALTFYDQCYNFSVLVICKYNDVVRLSLFFLALGTKMGSQPMLKTSGKWTITLFSLKLVSGHFKSRNKQLINYFLIQFLGKKVTLICIYS